jgi:SAM-dependent methyltransferase
VREQVVAALDALPPGPVTVVSICGGQGLELLGALADHPRRADVGGRLVELDERNAEIARSRAAAIGVDRLEVRQGDASTSDSYADLPRADLVVLSGVFGHLAPADRQTLIGFLPRICAADGKVVLTTYEVQPERTEELRAIFGANGFEEIDDTLTPGGTFGIIVEQLRGAEQPFVAGAYLFDFGSSHPGSAGHGD